MSSRSQHATRTESGHRVRRVAQLGAAACFGGLAVLVYLHQLGYRGWEAWSAARMTALFTSVPIAATPANATFYVGLPKADAFGLGVTGECTSAIVTVLVLSVTALLAAASRITLRRLMLAAFAAATTFYALNLARLVLIALATEHWGQDDGYHWSHAWAGTFVTVLGGVGVCVLYLYLLWGRASSRESHR